jgi:Methylamine utilisation protein MauE
MSFIVSGIRWFFVLLLAASSIGKLADMLGFYALIKSYALLPEAVIPISAWTLAIFESALAIWLAIGKRVEVAAVSVIALHFVYLIWLAIALVRGLNIPNCGCFGIYWVRPLTWFTLLEDLILLALAIVLWRSVKRKRSPT